MLPTWIEHVSLKLQKRQLEHAVGHMVWFRCPVVQKLECRNWQSFRCPNIQRFECIKLTHSEKLGNLFGDSGIQCCWQVAVLNFGLKFIKHCRRPVSKREIRLQFINHLHYCMYRACYLVRHTDVQGRCSSYSLYVTSPPLIKWSKTRLVFTPSNEMNGVVNNIRQFDQCHKSRQFWKGHTP